MDVWLPTRIVKVLQSGFICCDWWLISNQSCGQLARRETCLRSDCVTHLPDRFICIMPYYVTPDCITKPVYCFQKQLLFGCTLWKLAANKNTFAVFGISGHIPFYSSVNPSCCSVCFAVVISKLFWEQQCGFREPTHPLWKKKSPSFQEQTP